MVVQGNRFCTHLLTTLVVLSMNYCNCANIFCIFPTASHSHQLPQLALSHALAAKGHNLTVITTNPSKVPVQNHRDIDISHMYKVVRDSDSRLEKEMGYNLQKRSSGFDLINVFPARREYFYSYLFQIPELLNLIKEVNGTKYDLIIFEEIISVALVGFADLIGNPPMIGITTLHLPFISLADNPTIPSYIPSITLPFSDRMTLWERFSNLYLTVRGFNMMEWHLRQISEKYMHKYFGNTHHSLQDMIENRSLLIVSADLATGYAKPLQPNTIHVGPMHVKKTPDPLLEDIQKWMDESEDGVIYFSLGSNMQSTSMPEQVRLAFIEAFKQFPKVRVLWKWEVDTKLPGQPDNVLVKKWLPQQPILAHPKTRLFISQVGLQSFQEATYHGVPILGVPMFGDQDFNAKKVVTAGVGLIVEFHSVTYDILYEKMKELLTNNSYKENMRRQSLITRDTPMSPVDTAVWWVEYVLRHKGAPHLRPASLDLTWYQYYMVDILLIVLTIIVFILYLTYFILKKLINLFHLSPALNIKNNKRKRN